MSAINLSLVTSLPSLEKAKMAMAFVNTIRPPSQALSEEQISKILVFSQEAFQNISQQFSAFERYFWDKFITQSFAPGDNWSEAWKKHFNNCIACRNEELKKGTIAPYYNLLRTYFSDTVQALLDFEQYQNFTVVLDDKKFSGQEICDNIFHSLMHALHAFNQLLTQDNWQQEMSNVVAAFAKLKEDAQQLSRIKLESEAQEAAARLSDKAGSFACGCQMVGTEEFLALFLAPFQSSVDRYDENHFNDSNINAFYYFIDYCGFSLRAFCRRYEIRVSKLKKSIQNNSKLQEQDPKLQKALKGVLSEQLEILEGLQKALNILNLLSRSSEVGLALERHVHAEPDVFNNFFKEMVTTLSRLKVATETFFQAYKVVEQKALESKSLPSTDHFAAVAKLVSDCDREFRADFKIYCVDMVCFLQRQSALLTDSSLLFFQGIIDRFTSLGIDSDKDEDHYKGFDYLDFFKSKWLKLLRNVEASIDKNDLKQRALLQDIFFHTFWCFAQTAAAIEEDCLIQYDPEDNQGCLAEYQARAVVEKSAELQKLCSSPAVEELHKFVKTFMQGVSERAMFLLMLVDCAGKNNKIDHDLEFVRTFLKQYKTALLKFPAPDMKMAQEFIQLLESCQELDAKDNLVEFFKDWSQFTIDLQAMVKTLDCDGDVKKAMFFLTSHPTIQKQMSLIDDLEDILDVGETFQTKFDNDKFEQFTDYYLNLLHVFEGCLSILDPIFDWVDKQDKKVWKPYFAPKPALPVSRHEEPKEKVIEVKAEIAPLPVASKAVSVESIDHVLTLNPAVDSDSKPRDFSLSSATEFRVIHCLNRVEIVLQKTTNASPHQDQERLRCMQSTIGNMECYTVALSEILDEDSMPKLCSNALSLHLKSAMLLEQLFKYLIAYFDIRCDDSEHVLSVYRSEHDLQKLLAALRPTLNDNNLPIPAEIVKIIALLKDMSKKTSRSPLQEVSQTRHGVTKSVTSLLQFGYLQNISDCYDHLQNKLELTPLQMSWVQEHFYSCNSVDYPHLIQLSIKEEIEKLHKQAQEVMNFTISILEKLPQKEGEPVNRALILKKESLAVDLVQGNTTEVSFTVLSKILDLVQDIALQHASKNEKVLAIDSEADSELRQRRKFVTNALNTIPFCVTALRELYTTSHKPSSSDADSKLFFEALLLEQTALLLLSFFPIISETNGNQHVIFQDYSETRTISVSHDLKNFIKIIEEYLNATRSQSLHIKLPKRVSLLKHAYTISCRYPFDDKEEIGVLLNSLRWLGFLHHKYLHNQLLPSEQQLLVEACGANEAHWEAHFTNAQKSLQIGLEKGADQTFALVAQLLETMLSFRAPQTDEESV